MASRVAQDLQQKAEEFWNEIKDLKIPDVTTGRRRIHGKTTDQIIEDILEHEKVKTGIDWKAAAAAGAEKEWKAATDKAHSYLNGLKSKLSHGEIERAKQMGILNADGELPLFMELFTETDRPTTAPIPGGATPYPVWGWKPENAKKFQDAKGDEIKARILNLVRNFQAMDGSDARWMTKQFMECGFVGMRKRDGALIGTRGALKFKATESFPQGAYLGWSVPLAIGSNALLVSATYNGSVSQFSDKTGKHGKQEDTSTVPQMPKLPVG
ncbi:hypothetical protein OS493_038637 [Desmophyllum pertusum]|uniref:Uncharacterized protein n=1 Tax=Desmophyllum pertusum TaxID=174260 RepID=A0A9W9YA41_9CNID|nr:hypothetical protein OS493_038637 [Desmophyllum pertusum]